MNKEHFEKHSNEIETGLNEEELIYKENILDHYKHPHNKGKIKHNASCRELNPICGDEITAFLEIENEKIENISFEGHGCAISQAGISILTDEIKGKDVKEIKKMKSEDIYKLLGIPISVNRIKCALLSLKATQGAIKNYETRNN
ncbi:MAG: Fe-S cluster assembly sulfur transfer protein SufU [Nanoarchaeota archaeon]